MDLTHGRGVDYGFEAVGTLETQAEMIESVGKGSTAVLVGMLSFEKPAIETKPANLILYNKSLLGSCYGAANPATDIPFILQLYRDGLMQLDDMVTREYNLEDINQAFEDMLAGRNIRGVVRFV
jgi:S-(hydroxymethyl)glutathione dehydrogenase/alcohol dehydrogenase